MALFSSTHLRKAALILGIIVLIKVFLSYQTSFSFREHSLPQFIPSYSGPKSSKGYSIKPVAYIFPQYYVFEENNRLHGENFTEWVNVNKTTHNAFGLETIRPHESIGYYDGLEFQTRKRQGKFLRDSSIYGAAFHHYWFAGTPVMDHVIQAMLIDGEPDIPFMLSWANEPWSARWDGGNGGKVLIGQDYGLRQAWRKHFEWLLPFFRHPNYIRSEGKVQFMMYNPTHMGAIAPQMFAAFRQWAVEEGLGGMDIIETRWGEGSTIGPDSWRGHPPDAINEFQPHAGGRDIAKFSSLERLSRVYHRGTLACWDTTPRHPTDGRAVSLPACHPMPWENHLVEMFRKIKSDPNPIGTENFFFVNALNEWGEGNSIEPSMQFGDGYGIAMKNAMLVSEQEHKWPDTTMESSMAREKEIAKVMNQTADVCVLVRTSPVHAESEVFTLSAMFRSLQAQKNQKWRAVVYQSDKSDFSSLPKIISEALDARISRAFVPKDLLTEKRTEDLMATDWVLKNLTDVSPGCASAKYFLVTNGHNTYDSSAFDSLSTATADLVGMNVESRNNMWIHPDLQTNTSWADRCARLENPQLNFCKPSEPTAESFDLTATFISLPKFLSGNVTLSPPPTTPSISNTTTTTNSTSTIPSPPPLSITTDPTYPLITHLLTTLHWTHALTSPTTSTCHIRHNPTYSSCLKTGNFWFDSPNYNEVGCYTTTDFIEVVGRKSPNLKDADLGFFRERGLCMRYREEMFLKERGG